MVIQMFRSPAFHKWNSNILNLSVRGKITYHCVEWFFTFRLIVLLLHQIIWKSTWLSKPLLKNCIRVSAFSSCYIHMIVLAIGIIITPFWLFVICGMGYMMFRCIISWRIWRRCRSRRGMRITGFFTFTEEKVYKRLFNNVSGNGG